MFPYFKIAMSTYQPWLTKYIECIQHNTAVIHRLLQDIAIKHQQSDEMSPALACLVMTELQLLDQTTHLMSLLGKFLTVFTANDQFCV